MSELPPQNPEDDPNANTLFDIDSSGKPYGEGLDDGERLPEFRDVKLRTEPYPDKVHTLPTAEEIEEFDSLLSDVIASADKRFGLMESGKRDRAIEHWSRGIGKNPMSREHLAARMERALRNHPDFAERASNRLKVFQEHVATEEKRAGIASRVHQVSQQRVREATGLLPNYPTKEELRTKHRPDPTEHRYLGILKYRHPREKRDKDGKIILDSSGNPAPGIVRSYLNVSTPRSHREEVRSFHGGDRQPVSNDFWVGAARKNAEMDFVEAKHEQARREDSKIEPLEPAERHEIPSDSRRIKGLHYEGARRDLADDRLLTAYLDTLSEEAQEGFREAENRVKCFEDVIARAQELADEPVKQMEAKWKGETVVDAMEAAADATYETINAYRMGEVTTEIAAAHVGAINTVGSRLNDIDHLLKTTELNDENYKKLVGWHTELSQAYAHSRNRYHTVAIAAGDRTATYTHEKGIAVNDGSDLVLFEDGSYAYSNGRGIVTDRRNPNGSNWYMAPEDDPGDDFEVEGGLSTQELKDRQFAAFTDWFMDQSNPELRKRALAFTNELASALNHDALVEGDPEASRQARMQRYWGNYIAKQEYEPAENYVSIWPDGGIVKYASYYSREGWWTSYPDGSVALNEQDDSGNSRTTYRYDPYGNELPID